MSNQQRRYVLYYSNYCGHCKTLIQDMRQTPIINQLNLVCVDTMPKQNMPSFLKIVPTLIVNPSTPPLTGDNVFKWYDIQLQELRDQRSRAQMNVNSMVPQSTNQYPTHQQAGGGAAPNAGGGEPNAWHVAEMGSSFSDSYSYLGTDCSAQGMGGNSIGHSFAFVNANQNISNGEFPPLAMSSGGSVQQSSRKADELSARMEKMKAERDMYGGGMQGGMGRF